MNKLLKFLMSNTAVMLGAIASLLTQSNHSVNAFVHLEAGGSNIYLNYFFGVLFALSTSLSILIFTVRGRKNLAYFSLAVEVFVNVIHYGVIGMDLGPILFSTIFMCLIVPVYIAMYSGEVVIETVSVPFQQVTDFGDMSSFTTTSNVPKDEPYQYVDLRQEEAKQPSPILGKSELLHAVNSIIGFDVNDRSSIGDGKLKESHRDDIRSLWYKRNTMTQDQLFSNIKSIMSQSRQY